MIPCQLCGVWIPESESRYLGDFGSMTVRFWPEEQRCCRDKEACVRRQKDMVGTPAAAYDCPEE